VAVHIRACVPSWFDYESDEDTACSGDKNTPSSKKLYNVTPTVSVGASVGFNSIATPISTLTVSTDPSTMIDRTSGQTLLSIEIQLQATKEHVDLLLAETKTILDYIQDIDLSARFMPHLIKPDGTPFPLSCLHMTPTSRLIFHPLCTYSIPL
jgi:hypothetical protein